MTQPDTDSEPDGTVVPFRSPRGGAVPHDDDTGGTQAAQPGTGAADGEDEKGRQILPAPGGGEDRAEAVPHDDTVLQGVPVDRADVTADTGTYLARTRERMAQAPPIVHPVLRSRRDAAEAAAFVVRYNAYLMAFHTTRSPLYVLRLMSHSPRGTARLVARWWEWVVDAEAKPVRAKAAGSGDAMQWITLSREETRRTRPRKIASAILAGAGMITAFVAGVALPGWALGAGITLLLCGLGALGGNPDRPVITRFVSEELLKPLDSTEVVEALQALGIAKPKAADGGLRFAAPIMRDGPGWRAEVDLPPGVVAEKLLDRRAELAGAMRRPLACVWPSVGSEHPSRVILWVAQKDPRKIKRVWPLLAEGQVDLYAEFPFGVTPRGEVVPLALIGTNMLIGGVMGSGKTSAVLVIALAGALDPTCEMHVYELKGSGDMESVQPVCYRYVQGDDDEDCEQALTGMYALEREMKRRKKVIADLPVEDVPQGRKVTRKLAEKYPHLKLHPILAIFDEVHTLFEHTEYGSPAAEVAGRLIRKARAYGIILVVTTQKPDKDSIPKMISDNAILRFCLAITGHIANDLVLGTGMYKRGIRANIFEPAEGDDPKDSGTGWLSRSATNARIARAYFIGQEDAREVGRRALALRTAAGTLSGEAAGETVAEEDTSTIVRHLWEVWPDGAEAVHSRDLVAALAAYRPDRYGAWLEIVGTTEADTEAKRSAQLSAALKPFGVPTKQVHRRDRGGNRKGVTLDDLRRATPADEDA
ncbi:FtsK/SpoIIIE domain-containing protein [Streptomonospora algeriensis]|uniref:FtsK/SpoIIIE domain-containing protein n=1 Tax=Streptomonospora algeriensis TaxID=995084 RepID=A0ABW3BBV6_9ACTN